MLKCSVWHSDITCLNFRRRGNSNFIITVCDLQKMTSNFLHDTSKFVIIFLLIITMNPVIAQELKPIVLRDGRELVEIMEQTYLYEYPSSESSVLTDQYSNPEMLTEGCQVLVSREGKDWYKYQYEQCPETVCAYFPASNAKSIMTKGIPHKKSLFIKSWTDEPEEDETGCWQPSENALFIYPNNLGIMIRKGFENTMTIGLLDSGTFKPIWNCPVNYSDCTEHPDSLQFHIPASKADNQSVGIIVGRNCLLHNRGIKEDKLGMPDIFIYPPTDIVNIFIPNKRSSTCLISPGSQPMLVTAEELEKDGYIRYDVK